MNQVSLKFSDMQHFYLGCRCAIVDKQRHSNGKIYFLHQVDIIGKKVLHKTVEGLDIFITRAWKPILKPVNEIKKEQAAELLRLTFFPHVEYPLSDYKLEMVGNDYNPQNPRISIDNDFFTENLTFGNKTGSIWSGSSRPAMGVKISPILFKKFIEWQYDIFGFYDAGECFYETSDGALY